MKRKDFFTKAWTSALAAVVALTPAVSVLPVYAATSDTTTNNTAVSKDLADADIIDWSKTGSLTIHKYDITAAEAAKDYTEGDRIANGEKDAELEKIMKDYAVKGVQFTYMRVGNIETYSNTADTSTQVNVVYEIPTALADILKLDASKAYDMTAKGVSEKCTNEGVLHYDSTQLSDALAAILEEDAIAAKSALEKYVYNYGNQVTADDQSPKAYAENMPLTNKNGVTTVKGLKLGLYLLLETEVPEQVTDTTNPWFVSLPFTNITGEDDATGSEGGDYWLYDMTCYPKNQTGNPTLDKSVRNAYSTTGATDKNGVINSGKEYDYSTETGEGALVVWNNDSNASNKKDKDDASYVANRGGYTKDGQTAGQGGAKYSTDFEYRDTNTASAGDVLDYILVSKLPHITSRSTFLSEYTFIDILSAGIHYNKDVKVAFYDNEKDANANNTKNALAIWKTNDGNASDTYEVKVDHRDEQTGTEWKDGSEQMTITITEDGLTFINGDGVDKDGDGRSDNSMSDMYMVVYYTATVNSDASLVLGDAGNENDVVLTWQRTSEGYYNTLEDRNYIYSYSVDLTKTFSDGQGDLSKVGFKLYNSTDAYYVNAEYNEAEDVYYVTGKTVDKDSATTFVPHEGGKIIVYGLEADTYSMTEITTDNGYTLLEDSIQIKITPTDREINASVAGVTGMDKDSVNAIVQYYHGGIYDENGDLVTESKDYIKTNKTGNRPKLTAVNGRTVGKTDMYVGTIKKATAKVDKVAATMSAHTYKEGNMETELTSADATVVLDVVNNKNFTLPNTGGYGTILFTLAGCAAALGGVVLVTKKSKKSKKEV